MGVLLDQYTKWTEENSTAAELLREIEELPGLSNWRAPEPAAFSLPSIAQWGHVIGATKYLPGAEEIVARMASEILASGVPAPQTFSELVSPTLCSALGAVAGARIPEGP